VHSKALEPARADTYEFALHQRRHMIVMRREPLISDAGDPRPDVPILDGSRDEWVVREDRRSGSFKAWHRELIREDPVGTL
jgi:hypothetical protein